MKNFPRFFSSDLLAQGAIPSSIKPTSVEGLVLNHETRWPMAGVKIVIFTCTAEGERVLVQEMMSDNNGYFNCSFQAAANTFIMAPLKENFNFSGSYTILKEGERVFECELVKHGKNQFYTLTLQGREGAKIAKTESRFSSVNYTFSAFIRQLTALPVLRSFFSE